MSCDTCTHNNIQTGNLINSNWNYNMFTSVLDSVYCD